MTRRIRALAAASFLSLLAAACADTPAETPPVRSAGALDWVAEESVDLSGMTIGVGSREVGYHQVLGWVAYEVVAALGGDAIEQIGLGGSMANREAQLAGLVDLYWETTGTAWVTLLREFGPSSDARQLYEDVRDIDEVENDIEWVEPAPANAGLGLVMAPDVAEEFGIDAISELDELSADTGRFALCVPSATSFRTSPQGLVALRQAVDFRIRAAAIVEVPAPDLLLATEVGAFCPVAVVSLLDESLEDADVVVLDDDVGALLIENPSATLRADTGAESPGLAAVLADVSARIDQSTLRAMQAAVDEGADPRDVARSWLVDEGLAERRQG